MPKRKVLVVDTNVLLHDPRCITRFGDNIVVIPIWTIEELDRAKKCQDELGAHAREISRQIEAIGKNGSLSTGAPTEAGGILIVDYNGSDFNKLPVGLERSVDNRIILIAKAWQERKDKTPKTAQQKKAHLAYSDVIIVTKDTNLRIKASACGIANQDYLSDKLIERIEMLYSGLTTYRLPSAMEGDLRDHSFYKQGFIPAGMFASEIDLDKIYANQCCQFTAGTLTIDAVYKKTAEQFRIVPKVNGKNGKNGIAPINLEQRFAYDLLMDPDIQLVTLNGKAGSGKTLMALLAGYRQLDGVYDQLIIYRPNHEIGRPMGFLPGDIEEKFAPFMIPIFDNLKIMMDADPDMGPRSWPKGTAPGGAKLGEQHKQGNFNRAHELIREGFIEISPINHVRGRSVPKAFIVLDEGQNLTPLEAKTIISRAAEGTKIVITGDVYQIDNPMVDSISNGLSHTIERTKEEELAGHITLIQCERSPLAELAATLL